MTARQSLGRRQIAPCLQRHCQPTHGENPVRPCVEMMIKSARSFATASWIAVGQYPATADVSDRNTIEIDALQESSHLFTTSPARCFSVSGRIVIPAGCRHHHRAEISHVKHDNARANLFANRTANLRPAREQSEKSTGTRIVRMSRWPARVREVDEVLSRSFTDVDESGGRLH